MLHLKSGESTERFEGSTIPSVVRNALRLKPRQRLIYELVDGAVIGQRNMSLPVKGGLNKISDDPALKRWMLELL